MGISGHTQLVGVIGWPIEHTFSPAMHNAAFTALKLDWRYLPLPVRPADLETAVRGLPALGFRGFNVTVPHKQTIAPLLDLLDKEAEALGAVNTVVIDTVAGRSQLVGYNSDASGLMADVVSLGIDIADRDCLVLGAGGSARAAAYGLARAGGRVRIFARRVDQAIALVKDLAPHLSTTMLPYRPSGARLAARPLSDLPEAVETSDSPLIINATPVGMAPNVDGAIWPERLPFPKGAFVYDLVYNPRQTKLMQAAEAAGCGASNGLGMLVQQGALAFQLWTGHAPDTAVMSRALPA